MPTKQVFERVGGLETKLHCHSTLAENAADVIVREATSLLMAALEDVDGMEGKPRSYTV